MDQPEVSIVIRTYNEARFLPDLLESIKLQRYNRLETIVVDSGSIDGTLEIAEKQVSKVIGIQSRDFTFGYSLNIGIQSAAGRLIVMASAHTLPLDENWLAKLVDPFSDEKVAMTYGRQVGCRTSKFSEIRDLQQTYGTKRKILKPPRFFANNANSAIRKDLWHKHPFDETLLGLEDIEWAKYWMKRGYQVVYEPLAALYHIHEETWRQVRRRYFREAVAARRIGIQGIYYALTAPIVETGRMFADLKHLIFRNDQKPELAASNSQLAGEIIMFRHNKVVGTIKGLLTSVSKENQEQNEEILFDRYCKAAVIHGVNKVSIDEIQIPKVKPGDVLIRGAYEAVCATDIEIFEGTLGYYKNGMAKYPIIPGHEFSGQVVAIGPNVDQVDIGDHVVVECIQSCGECEKCHSENFLGCEKRTELGVIDRNGGYAEYLMVPGKFVHRLPPELDMISACLCEPLAVALKGLKRLRRTWRRRERKDSKQCAVVGAGPLGHLCAQVLAIWGHQVTVFDRNPQRLGYFSNSSIATSNDLDQLSTFDNIVEATGDPVALDNILHKSPAGATILLLGLPYAHRSFTFEGIVAYDKIVVGSVGSSAKHFELAIEMLPQIETGAFTEKVLPLSDFKEAWKLAKAGKYLKVILKLNNDLI
jgi:2-desacetyl-2-hydroxyethyl bacteriochlorophyllide A dehydrogenase